MANRYRGYVPTSLLGTAWAWEDCRARVLASWGQHTKAAEAAALADLYARRLQEESADG